MSMNDKVALLKELYHEIAGKGQDGDTMLAHINPQEALLLKAHGGSGTINPNTGLPEYKNTNSRSSYWFWYGRLWTNGRNVCSNC